MKFISLSEKLIMHQNSEDLVNSLISEEINNPDLLPCMQKYQMQVPNFISNNHNHFKRKYSKNSLPFNNFNKMTILKSIFKKSNYQILIVDDNMFNIMALISLFNQLPNIQIFEAYNGEEAVNIVKSKGLQDNFNIILMDVNMPVMDGIEAIKIIRKLQNNNIIAANIKIVSVTAFTDKNEKDKCFKAGADGFLAKPVTMDSMILTMKEILGNES